MNLDLDFLKKIILSKETKETIDTVKNVNKECNYNCFNKPDSNVEDKCVIGNDVFNDIEMVTSYTGEKGVIDDIDNTILKGSRSFLTELLLNPIDSIKSLKKRQKVLKSLFNNIEIIKEKLVDIEKCEQSVVWIYNNVANKDDIDALQNMIFFNNIFTNVLNKRAEVLTGFNLYRILVSPIVGIISPIVYFIIPYLIVRMKVKLNISFIDYLKLMFQGLFNGNMMGSKISMISSAFSLIFYFQGIFNSIEVAKASYQISKFLTDKMNDICKFIQIGNEIYDKYWTSDIDVFFNEKEYIRTDEFQNEKIYKNGFEILSNFGTKLKCYKYFDFSKYELLLRKIYILDTLTSIANLQNKPYNFSYPTYSNSKTPTVSFKDIKHPSLIIPILNDLNIESKSLILTGPNAGGKSTFIKSILLSILFGQSIGLTNTSSMTFTPFYFINSQMNIPDCKGKESLFEAEMYRSKENLDCLKQYSGKLSAIFMDEIFNSTNPIEGISGAYAIAKNMAKYNTNITFITTHYIYLTKLASHQPDKFVNMKMNVIHNDKEIKYPYKIIPGISRQYIALELLKLNGFDIDVVEDALAIKKRLS